MNATEPMVVHYVKDMDRALPFYRDVLGLKAEFESTGWSTLRCGGCIVALHILSAGMIEGAVAHAGLNLHVDDLDAAMEEVTGGGGEVRNVREAGGGIPVRIAVISDTEGNVFELRQFVGD
ncbi:MAG: VOC family protein [Candidatus Latescibacteria bacterium]|nr:VOC family protein [Candidatus Latescibacterota bacterium]